jgi:hypothetical protein
MPATCATFTQLDLQPRKVAHVALHTRNKHHRFIPQLLFLIA